jgi:hypothetical protein
MSAGTASLPPADTAAAKNSLKTCKRTHSQTESNVREKQREWVYPPPEIELVTSVRSVSSELNMVPPTDVTYLSPRQTRRIFSFFGMINTYGDEVGKLGTKTLQPSCASSPPTPSSPLANLCETTDQIGMHERGW